MNKKIIFAMAITILLLSPVFIACEVQDDMDSSNDNGNHYGYDETDSDDRSTISITGFYGAT